MCVVSLHVGLTSDSVSYRKLHWIKTARERIYSPKKDHIIIFTGLALVSTQYQSVYRRIEDNKEERNCSSSSVLTCRSEARGSSGRGH